MPNNTKRRNTKQHTLHVRHPGFRLQPPGLAQIRLLPLHHPQLETPLLAALGDGAHQSVAAGRHHEALRPRREHLVHRLVLHEQGVVDGDVLHGGLQDVAGGDGSPLEQESTRLGTAKLCIENNYS